jgi:hypothetical protein
MSNIVVAGAYRSGSNHIAESLARALGSIRTYLCSPLTGYAMDHQTIDLGAADAIFNRFQGVVFLAHITASKRNLGIFNVLQPKVIVTQRKVIPSIQSLRRYEDIIFKQGNKARHVTREWDKWSNDQKWRWIAYYTIPWYYQFYVSWHDADYPVHFVKFEKHFEDQIASGREILRYLDIEARDELITSAFIHKDANYMEDRTEYEIPDWLEPLAIEQAKAWGPWAERIMEDLL